MSSHSTSTTPTPSSPHTPPPTSPNFKLTLPTPPSFSAHRSNSHSRQNSRNTSSTNLVDLINSNTNQIHIYNENNTQHTKRLSISSINDPIVSHNNNNEKNDRRVSFSIETQNISRPLPLPLSMSRDNSSDSIGNRIGEGLKSPIYKIPQRKDSTNENEEEILNSPNLSELPITPSAKRRPISFQGISPSLLSSINTSPSRFASMAASKGISIEPSLSKINSNTGGNGSGSGFSRSIWSAGILPSTKSGWISPLTNNSSTKSPTIQSYSQKSISSTLKSPIPLTINPKSPTSPANRNGGTATEIAKARGLSIAIIKENGKGVVVPITPGLPTGNNGLKSPTGLVGSLKSPEVKILTNIDTNNGLQSAKSTGVPDTAGSGGKKEVILCKFYHTPGLTCTSRPCRFVHNLSSIQPMSGVPNTAALSGFRMLSPTQPDPTFGTFAQAQMTPSSTKSDEFGQPKKIVKLEGDGSKLDLGDIMPGEKILLQDENGEEAIGQVFFMSGGGKGAMGKSREKWKTVPCKDFAEGRCPYGDYCSFIHDEKLPTGVVEEEPKSDTKPASKVEQKPEEEKPQRRLTHRKSASLSSSLTAWTKALPKAILVPSVKVDPKVLQKNEVGLSAFAPPFRKDPITVDETGDLVPALPSPKPQLALPIPAQVESHRTTTPPARVKEPISIPMEPTITAPPKSNVWSKGPPPNLRKVASIKILTLTSTLQNEEYEYTRTTGLTPPNSATGENNLLMPPVSAFSMFGTESDPASPFDPVVQRRKLKELEDQSKERERELPKSNLSQIYDNDLYSHPQQSQSQYLNQYQQLSPPIEYSQPNPVTSGGTAGNIFNSTTYPWGMPMSPLPGYNDPSIPTIPGGLGVIWTPAGWAVQDAAMKNALRSAEVKARYGEVTKRRTAKNYFRTKPCKFFNEGFCPHGDECTYMHILVPSSPEQTSSSSGSDSGSISQTFSPIQLNPSLQPSLSNSTQIGTHPKHQTLPCKFFNSSLGCNNGSKCSFLHTRVVPESVNLVERPRPWRTKPCRHYQLGRCTLGDACHFAHVLDPAWLNSGSNNIPSYLNGENENKLLTEESLEKTLQEMRRSKSQLVIGEDDDEDDDDLEIVTAVGDLTFSSSSYSPPSSIRV